MEIRSGNGVATSERETENKHVETHKFLIHHKGDHVGVATSEIKGGEDVLGVYMEDGSSVEMTANSNIPLGHKIALKELEVNEPVIKYGVQIGLTNTQWKIGDYVHTHNIKTARW